MVKPTRAKSASESKHLAALKHIGALAAIFLCLQGIFFACNVCAELVPKGPIEQHIQESQDDPLITRKFDYHFRVFGSPVSYDNNRFLQSMAEKDDYDGDLVKASVLDTIDYDIGEGTARVDYYRYWHGWQLLTFICLALGPVSFLSTIMAIIVLIATAFFLVELKRYIGWLPAIAFVGIAFLATNILGNFEGDLLMALSVFSLVACCAATLHWGTRYKPKNLQRRGEDNSLHRIDALCLVGGCLFCFLDFFTIPSFAIALSAFTCLIASGAMQRDFKRGIVLFIRFSLIFGIGFIATWMTKWLIAACYLGLPTVMENVIGEMGFWSQSNESLTTPILHTWLYEIDPRLYAFTESFYFVLRDMRLLDNVRWNPAGIAAFALCSACVAISFVSWLYSYVKRRSRNRSKKSSMPYQTGIWALYLPALFAPVYSVLAFSHTIWHIGIFGYKPWSASLAILACMSLYMALCRMRPSIARWHMTMGQRRATR